MKDAHTGRTIPRPVRDGSAHPDPPKRPAARRAAAVAKKRKAAAEPGIPPPSKAGATNTRPPRIRRGLEVAVITAPPRSDGAPARPDEREVAERAFLLFQERGAEPGHALDDWLRAERELAEAQRGPR